MEMSERSQRLLIEQRFKSAEYERNIWVANAEHGTNIAEVLQPSYWAHVADKLRPYDRIEVRVDGASGCSNCSCCRLTAAGLRCASCTAMTWRPVEEVPTAIKHKVEWKGPQLKWCVIRQSDNEIIFKGITDKGQAQHEAERHERMLA
jgi:hypothetical protein